jgi:hypothetical protein
VRLREHGRNVLVEVAESNGSGRGEDSAPPAYERREVQEVEAPPQAAAAPRATDGIREVRRIFQAAPNPPRFPMYVRQAKQFMRAVDPAFDERKFGFGSLQDLLRACQREGLFRIERDRQGVIRLFAGTVMQPVPGGDDIDRTEEERSEVPEERTETSSSWDQEESAVPGSERMAGEPVEESPSDRDEYEEGGAEVVEGAVVQELDFRPVVDAEEAPESSGPEPGNEAVPPPSRRGRGTRTRATQPRSPRRPAGEAAAPGARARKAPARSRGTRAKKSSD